MGAAHPTDETLRSYGLGELDGISSASVSTHLGSCPDCRQRAAEMSSDSFFGWLRKVRGPTEKAAADRSPAVSSTAAAPADLIQRASPETMPPGLSEHPDYEVIRELGRGGMGVVYLAHNRLMGRNEVLKVMSRHIMERPGLMARFLAEIRAVARLQHPNIVTAYSAFRLGESILFAMEYVEGLDLAKMVKAKGALPVAHACYFVNQAAQGMQHAHERGMVHRDIKPGNLMLSHQGNRPVVKVLDFGLAKATREAPVDGGLTNPGQALGTPDYMAPEQIRDAQKADIRADIYSLGCTLYYLLSGGPPFHAENLWDLYQAHHSMDAKLLNFVRPEVPSELAALVAKMMAKEPRRRFQTPAEVAQALTPFFKKGSAGARLSNTELSLAGQSERRPEPSAKGPVPPRVTPVKKSPEKARRVAEWESLVEFKETEPLTGPAPAPAAPRYPTPPWIWSAAAAGLLLVGLFVAWAAVVRVRTANGMIELINLPRDAEVFVDGEEVAVTWPVGGKPAVITVTAGKHKVIVKKDGLEISGDEVTVQADGKEAFKVRFVAPGELPKDDDPGLAVRNPRSPGSFNDSIGMRLNLIPAGEFMMGSLGDDEDAGPDERPRHRVRITKPFYLGIYEVTQAQYIAVMGNNPSHFSSMGHGRDQVAGQSTERHPVENLSWREAVWFCNALSRKERLTPYYVVNGEDVEVPDSDGRGYRLPTEAEWEYACRAGTTAKYSFGDGPSTFSEYGWFKENSMRATHPVGQKLPNRFGLYDMHGNVWEWCSDAYNGAYYGRAPGEDPLGAAGASDRVNRGGGWSSGPRYCRSASRSWNAPGYWSFSLGFRVALSKPPTQTTQEEG